MSRYSIEQAASRLMGELGTQLETEQKQREKLQAENTDLRTEVEKLRKAYERARADFLERSKKMEATQKETAKRLAEETFERVSQAQKQSEEAHRRENSLWEEHEKMRRAFVAKDLAIEHLKSQNHKLGERLGQYQKALKERDVRVGHLGRALEKARVQVMEIQNRWTTEKTKLLNGFKKATHESQVYEKRLMALILQGREHQKNISQLQREKDEAAKQLREAVARNQDLIQARSQAESEMPSSSFVAPVVDDSVVRKVKAKLVSEEIENAALRMQIQKLESESRRVQELESRLSELGRLYPSGRS